MNGRIVFLLEEPSMKELLEQLLPRVFPSWISGSHFICIPHRGKDDLQKSIPRKLLAWRLPQDRFVIVQDRDRGNCQTVKAELLNLCSKAGRQDVLVRIVCQELEAWYVGDLGSLQQEYLLSASRLRELRRRSLSPDSLDSPSSLLEKTIPGFQKISGARRMGRRITPQTNQSHSFRVFISGIQRLASEMGYLNDGATR